MDVSTGSGLLYRKSPEEAIKLYNLWAASSYKMTACDNNDECCLSWRFAFTEKS
jgi:hypothetical protein